MHDRRVDFGADEDSKEANDWDDELEDFESEDEEDLFAGL